MHRFFPRTDDRYCGGTASLMPQTSGEPAAVQICRLTDKLIYPRHAAEMPRTRGGPAAVPSNGISWTNFRKESVYSKFKIYFYRFIVSPFQEYTATKTQRGNGSKVTRVWTRELTKRTVRSECGVYINTTSHRDVLSSYNKGSVHFMIHIWSSWLTSYVFKVLICIRYVEPLSVLSIIDDY